MNKQIHRKMTPQQAIAELRGRLLTLVGIAVFCYIVFRLLSAGEGFRWDLMWDSCSAAIAIYLPFRLGRGLTGTVAGGAIVSLVILIWMSTWINGREWLVWLMLVAGFVADFGPCLLALLPEETAEC